MEKFKNIRRRIERFFKQLLGFDIWTHIEVRVPKEKFGTLSNGYFVAFPEKITENTIVYSVGVGREISFDLDLINKKNVTVYAFDPTPRAKEWIRTQKLPEKFKFFDIGVADFDGIANFYEPENPRSTSYSLVEQGKHILRVVKCPVKRLKTIMEMLGHKKIDILKMDIEGGEYKVIEDIIKSKIQISQILVEFHHRKKNIGIYKTKRAITSLRENNFRIFYISPKGEEYSFIKIEKWK